MEKSQSRVSRSVKSRGFTLIELLVVIAIIGTLISLLLPAVQSVRKTINKERAAAVLVKLSDAAQEFFSQEGKVPESMDELADFCERFPALCDLTAVLADGMSDGHVFHISSPDAFTFVGEAEPYAGITGSETLLVDLNGNISSIPTPGAEKNEQLMFDRIYAMAAETIADLMQMDPRALNEIRESGFPTDISEISRLLDADGDEMLSSGEIFEFRIGNDLSDKLREFLQYARNEMRLGLYDENPDLHLISLGQGGDPTDAFFNYDTMIRLTNLFVADRRVARSMSSELKEAARFARNGQDSAELEAAQAYLRLLQEATHGSITREHAVSLSLILRTTTQAPIP